MVLSEKQVLKIRAGAAGGVAYAKLAERFDCTTANISRVAIGNSYPNFGGPLTQKRKSNVTKKKAAKEEVEVGQKRLTKKQVLAIRDAIAAGATTVEVAEEYGVRNQSISLIARGESYSDVGGPRTIKNPSRKDATDLAALSVDDAGRFLQALTAVWPQYRESFIAIDSLISGGTP